MEAKTIKVFNMNDCDWWAGEDAESVKAAFLAVNEVEPTDDPIEPTEVSPEKMRTMEFVDGHDKRTFAEELDRLIAEAHEFPCFFASTEY